MCIVYVDYHKAVMLATLLHPSTKDLVELDQQSKIELLVDQLSPTWHGCQMQL